MAPGSSAAVFTRVAPSADPPRAGLTNSGSPSVATMRSSTAVAPRSWKVSFGSVTEAGVASPAAWATAFATGLSNANRQASGRRPDERHAQQRQDLLDRAVLPVGAVDGREDRAGRVAGDRRDQARVRVGDVGLDARLAQRVAQPAARAQRHLPLGGQAAGQDQHMAQVAHCCMSEPAGPVSMVGPAPDGR